MLLGYFCRKYLHSWKINAAEKSLNLINKQKAGAIFRKKMLTQVFRRTIEV